MKDFFFNFFESFWKILISSFCAVARVQFDIDRKKICTFFKIIFDTIFIWFILLISINTRTIIFSPKCNFKGQSFTMNCFLCLKSMKLYLSGNMCSWPEYIFGFFLRRLWMQKSGQITNSSEKLWLFDHLHITFYFILTNFYNHILFDISYMNKSVWITISQIDYIA